MLVTLETGTPFTSIILNIVVTFQHKTLLNNLMVHIRKVFFFVNHVGLLLFEQGCNVVSQILTFNLQSVCRIRHSLILVMSLMH